MVSFKGIVELIEEDNEYGIKAESTDEEFLSEANEIDLCLE